MELNLEESMKEKRLAIVESTGYIELSPDVSETMEWEPGTEIMGTKVDGLLILEPFRPRCKICDSAFRVKEVRGEFLCEDCINRAKKNSFYEYYGEDSDEAWRRK